MTSNKEDIIRVSWQVSATKPELKAVLDDIDAQELREVLRQPRVRDSLREFLVHFDYEEGGPMTFKFKEYCVDTSNFKESVMPQVTSVRIMSTSAAMALTREAKAGELDSCLPRAVSTILGDGVTAAPGHSKEICVRAISMLEKAFREAGYVLTDRQKQLNKISGLLKLLVNDRIDRIREFEYLWNTKHTFRHNYLMAGMGGEENYDYDASTMSRDALHKMHNRSLEQAQASINQSQPPGDRSQPTLQQRSKPYNRGENLGGRTIDPRHRYRKAKEAPVNALEIVQPRTLHSLCLPSDVQRKIKEDLPKLFKSNRHRHEGRVQEAVRLLARGYHIIELWTGVQSSPMYQPYRRVRALRKLEAVIDRHGYMNRRLLDMIQSLILEVIEGEDIDDQRWSRVTQAIGKRYISCMRRYNNFVIQLKEKERREKEQRREKKKRREEEKRRKLNV